MPDVLLHQRRSAVDTATATAVVSSVLGAGEVSADEGDFTYAQWSLVDDGVSVGRIVSTGNRVRLKVVRPPDLIVVAVSEGRMSIARADQVEHLEAGGCGLLALDETTELSWDEVRFELFAMPVESVVRVLPGDRSSLRMHAPRLTPKSAELQRFWRQLASLLASQVLSDPDIYERDLLRTQIIQSLAAATIEVFDLTDVSADDLSRDQAVHDAAEEYIRTHLSEPIAIADVAAAAKLSMRGLQVVYQRLGDETPLGHLRRLRLGAARHELQTGLGGTTVTSVARRYGYTNIGRFGAHYRDAFGESPSTTLQRRGSR